MKRNKFSIASLALAFCAIVLMGFSTTASAEKPADNYKLYCWQCHGTKGVGKGMNAPHLSVQPRNHTSAKDMGALTKEGVFKAIKFGGVSVAKSTQMPPFAAIMTDDEIKALVDYLYAEKCKCEAKK